MMTEKLAQEGDLQHRLILDKANQLGIKMTDLSSEIGSLATLLEKGNKRELLVKGIPTSWINMQTRFLCDQKQLSKVLFERLNIPHPKSLLFSDPQDLSITEFMVPGKSYVCKPQVGANGIGVELDITEPAQVLDYVNRKGHLDRDFLIEEQLEGQDIRIQVIGGQIVAACIREPAFVTGNGLSTLDELIQDRQAVIKSQNPSNSLELDETSLKLIDDQGLTLKSVPAKDRKIVLKQVSNIGQGGIATDISDELHPGYYEWIEQIGAFLQSSYFALDLMGEDPQKDPIKRCFALELNAQAEWGHHTFSERRTHDLATVVLRTLFGDTLG